MLVWILRTIVKNTLICINEDCKNVGKGLKNGKSANEPDAVG